MSDVPLNLIAKYLCDRDPASITNQLSPKLGKFLSSCWGSLPPAVNFYRSCVGLGWLAQETTRFILVRASEE
jgi:hypothetical protein